MRLIGKKAQAYNQALHHYRLGSGPFNSAHRLELIYKMQDEASFDGELKKIIMSRDVNPLLGAIQKHASIRYGKKNNNLFCNEPFKYIYHRKLSQKDGFNDELSEKLLDTYTKLDSAPQELLKNGIKPRAIVCCFRIPAL